ncbi:MAG TPA: alkaline phosphatase family protein [Candidatus Saccharimonadales bacterium]|nr:alkaline phosphatase family protein [Candidatus Saccharimonadales bacterium]
MSTYVQAYSGTKIRTPDYDGKCIVQLPAFFQNTLLSNRDNALSNSIADKIRLEGVKNIVFFLVDGFGVKQWETYKSKYKALQRFEQDGYINALESVFPSSTPVALNTLHTNGLLPAQHGLIDWWLYVEEIDKIIATLPFAAMGNEEMDSLLKIGAKPSILLDNPTTYEQFEAQGIKTKTFILKGYLQSVYTKVAYKGSELIPHVDITELFATLSNELAKPQEKPTYNFVYWGGIDGTGHQYGPDTSEYRQVVNEYFTALEDFLAKVNDTKNTLFVISADHGQVNVNPKETIYLDKIAGLANFFRISKNGNPILPWGGKREMFMAINDDEQADALKLLRDKLGEDVELVESEEALRAGLFGEALAKHPHLKSRIGDMIVLPKGNKTVWYLHPNEEPYKHRGEHGGLSEAELKVPFGLLRLN